MSTKPWYSRGWGQEVARERAGAVTWLLGRFGEYALLETAATTYSVPKRSSTSPEALRAFLETIDGVIL